MPSPTGASDIGGYGVTVNFPEEMFNDALDFAEKANEAEHIKDIFGTWRWTRLCIICSALCFESYLNQLVDIHQAKLPADVESIKRKSIEDKLFDVFPRHGILSSPIDKGRQPYQELAWLVKLRNELVHYKGGQKGKELYERELTPFNAKRAVEAVRRMILHLNTLSSTPTPPWVNQTSYRREL